MLPLFYQNDVPEAGVDEAGRGCYAGPVYAAAVILPKGFYHPQLNDSKQLNARQREILREVIEREAVSWAVASVDNKEIDRTNILKASYKAMHLAIAQLNTKPGLLLVDGNRFRPYPKIKHTCIIKGDSLYASIAAASILAKTHRDAHLDRLHTEFPQYGWDRNKGYGTLEHRTAIETFGLCKYHRKSYNILSSQTELGL